LICNWNSLESLRLINLPSIILYSIKFSFFIRPVILRKIINSHSILSGHHSSAISNIGNIALSFNCKYNNSTWSRFIESSSSLVSIFQKSRLCYLTSFLKSFERIFRKTRLINNNCMQMIFKKISTIASSMSIINCKKRAFRPSFWIFSFGFSHIKNDRYSVFIIVSLYTLMCICRITSYQPMRFRCEFSIFKIFKWMLIILLSTSHSSQKVSSLYEYEHEYQ
jgi:hypothetical protein